MNNPRSIIRAIASRSRLASFTLLEILLAIAVLLILLSFLFQFISSAQRLWRASENTADLFAQAQLALQLLEKDLQASLFCSDPGHSMPMGGSNNRLFFFTQDAAAGEVGTYLVMYVWNFETDELYRYGWTEEIDGKPPHFFYGLEPTTENMAEIESALTALADSAQGCRLATGVTNISIESPPDNDLTEENSLYFFTTRPKILKLTLTLYDAKAVAQMQNTGANATAIESKIAESARQFSKIIFLP